MAKHLTAIEWLHISLHDHLRNCTNEDREHIKELIRQAKQREREQTGEWIETHWYEEINGKNYKLFYNKNNEWKW